jgi:hypothetical protein
MEIYSDLFESMIDCCNRIGFLNGVLYTAAMMALGLGLCLNLLSVIDLLWTLGLVDNPYRSNGSPHPQHYVYAVLCIGFVANTGLARVKFNTDRQFLRAMPQMPAPQVSVPKPSLIRTPGPAYVLSSAVLFLATLTLDLLVRR